jgi:cell fate regulator YaaT (PSP1 superfamily)
MARDQGLVINPSKISGVCGRLLCCIRYENSQYEEALHEFPAVGQRVLTNIGSGRVMSLNPLNGYLYIDVEGKGMNKYPFRVLTNIGSGRVMSLTRT